MTRYTPIGTTRLGGRLVARIRDEQAQREVTVYKRGQSIRLYATDRPVSKGLARVARELLKQRTDEDAAREALRVQRTVVRA